MARISVQQFVSLLYIGPVIFFPGGKYICTKDLEEIVPRWKCMDSPLAFSYHVW